MIRANPLICFFNLLLTMAASLSASAATFRARRDQLWQITMSPRGVPGGYRVPR